MKQFEYQTIVVKPKTTNFLGTNLETEEMDKILNERGNEGWELVSVHSYTMTGSTISFLYTFKREKR